MLPETVNDASPVVDTSQCCWGLFRGLKLNTHSQCKIHFTSEAVHNRERGSAGLTQAFKHHRVAF